LQTFGFGLGLDFRESALLMNTKNAQKFAANMVFNLAVGFHDLPLNASDKSNALGSIQKLSKYSMLVSDTVMIRAQSRARA
jgi:nucleosome binding factor SPN SPT16 subunit